MPNGLPEAVAVPRQATVEHSPGRRGQKLGARVQRADQLDLEPAPVGDAVDLLEQRRRPGRDTVERLRAEPAQVVAGQPGVDGEEAPVDVHDERDPLLLGAPEGDSPRSRRAFGGVVAGDVHRRSIIVLGTSRGRGGSAYPLPGMRAIVGVDVGGTFTDVALIAGGRLVTAKVATTVADHAVGVIEGVRLALERAGLVAGDVAHFGHGTTVATNAMLERRGARTAYVATRGFADVPALGRQARPHLYRPESPRPRRSPRSRPRWTSGWARTGCIAPLEPRSVSAAARRLRRARVEAVAVCLLHAYADPAHERAVADGAARRTPGRPRGGIPRGRGRVP